MASPDIYDMSHVMEAMVDELSKKEFEQAETKRVVIKAQELLISKGDLLLDSSQSNYATTKPLPLKIGGEEGDQAFVKLHIHPQSKYISLEQKLLVVPMMLAVTGRFWTRQFEDFPVFTLRQERVGNSRDFKYTVKDWKGEDAPIRGVNGLNQAELILHYIDRSLPPRELQS